MALSRLGGGGGRSTLLGSSLLLGLILVGGLIVLNFLVLLIYFAFHLLLVGLGALGDSIGGSLLLLLGCVLVFGLFSSRLALVLLGLLGLGVLGLLGFGGGILFLRFLGKSLLSLGGLAELGLGVLLGSLSGAVISGHESVLESLGNWEVLSHASGVSVSEVRLKSVSLGVVSSLLNVIILGSDSSESERELFIISNVLREFDLAVFPDLVSGWAFSLIRQGKDGVGNHFKVGKLHGCN